MLTLASARPTRRLSLVAPILLGMAGQGLAQGTAEQREACTPDALRLCSETIPDVERTTACMKRHEAELSPRCHAAFNAPSAGARIETSRSRERAADMRKRQAAREGSPDEREERVLRPRPGATASGPDDDQEQRVSRDDAFGEDDGPDIRRFRPGDGPEDGRIMGGGPPDGYDWPDEGRDLGPPSADDPRFAGRDPAGDDPGPRSYGRPGAYGDSDDTPYGYAAPNGSGAPLRHGQRRARAVIARLCAAGEIDPRTCAVTRRALKHDRE